VANPAKAGHKPPLRVRDLRLGLEQINADFEIERFSRVSSHGIQVLYDFVWLEGEEL